MPQCVYFTAIVLNMSGQQSAATVSSTAAAAASVAAGTTSMYHLGLLCVASASMLSGLSAALTQRALSGVKPRHTLMLSAEMAVYGILFLLINLYFNNDIKSPSGSLLSNWNLQTLIPVTTNVS